MESETDDDEVVDDGMGSGSVTNGSNALNELKHSVH